MDCYSYTKRNVNVVAPAKVRILCVDVSDGASDKEHDLAYVDVNQLLQVNANVFSN